VNSSAAALRLMHPLETLLRAALTVCALYYLIVFCVLASIRMFFPGALELVEGSMFCHVSRVLEGRSLYVEPSVEFVPSIYPPLYFYTSAALSSLTGTGFAALRLISFFSALGSMALIGVLVRGETGSRAAGLWAAGLFAATYRLSASYLDIGRIDSLFLLLLLGSLTALRFSRGMPGSLLAAGLLVCAALTKQTALALSLPLMLYAFMARPRKQALAFAALFAVSVVGITALLSSVSSGWYFYYVFELPGRHPILWARLAPFWTEQLLPFGITVCMALCFPCMAQLRHKRAVMLLYALLIISLTAVACMSWIKCGGFKNVLIPAHAACAIGAGLALGAVRNRTIRITLCCATAVQFALLWYNPLTLLPGPDHAQIFRTAVSSVQRIHGDVFAPTAGHLCLLAGKKNSAHIGCINDVLRGGQDPVHDRLITDIRKAIRTHEFAVILLDRPFGVFQADIDQHYMPCPEYARHPLYWPLIRYWYIPRTPHT